MDPLGFALEGFDAIGGYRELPVEQTSGTLPSGRELNGPASVREMLLANREEFVGTVTEKLLTYGLGRGWSTTTSRGSGASCGRPRRTTTAGRR